MSKTSQKNITPIIFGPNVWKTIDCFIATLPNKLNKNQINDCFNFFKSFETLIPCSFCRNSYSTYNNELDTNIYDLNNYKTRDKIIHLVFNLRNKVNNKLGMDYGITLNYYKLKLNNITTPNDKNMEWAVFNIYNAPFIQKNTQKKIYNFLEKEKIDVSKIKQFIINIKNFMMNITEKDITFKNKSFKLFVERNKKCFKLKNKIYENQIKNDYNIKQSFHNDKDLYMKLFNLGCSILTPDEIDELFD